MYHSISDYLWDIENITWAQTGLIDAWEANRFFDEASQMIANSIFLFQKGNKYINTVDLTLYSDY